MNQKGKKQGRHYKVIREQHEQKHEDRDTEIVKEKAQDVQIKQVLVQQELTSEEVFQELVRNYCDQYKSVANLPLKSKDNKTEYEAQCKQLKVMWNKFVKILASIVTYFVKCLVSRVVSKSSLEELRGVVVLFEHNHNVIFMSSSNLDRRKFHFRLCPY